MSVTLQLFQIKIHYQLYFPVKKPGGNTLWLQNKLTNHQKEIIDNATIGIIAEQLYNQRYLMTNSGPLMSQTNRMNAIRSESQCVSEDYRCRLMDKKCDFNAR